MPKAKPVRMARPEFVSVARIRQLTGCYPGTVLRLVMRGLVENRLDHFSGFPLYRLDDIRRNMPPKRGRPSKDSFLPKAKKRKATA